MEQLKKIWAWIQSFPDQYWKKYSTAQKILVAGGASIIVFILLFTIISVANPRYQLLVRGLTDVESGQIVRALEEMGVPYRAVRGSIYIPASADPDATRMKLSADGILGGAIKGFEIMEEQPFGATSFDKQVRYQIALQGALARSIMTIHGIQFAQVLLTIPKFTYYVRGEDTQPKASVMLTLSPGVTLRAENVKAIMELVAGAVEGMDMRDVKVVDNMSRMLSDVVAIDSDMGLASSRMELKKMVETYYTSKVRSSLEQVFGPGKVVVLFDALLNFETIEREVKEYTPVTRTAGIIASQQTEREESRTGTPGDPVGVDANVPPTYESTTLAMMTDYSREKSIINYNVNEAYERVMMNRQGEIIDKNLTVLIDATAVSPDLEAATIQSFVANAINASVSNVEVQFLAFDRSLEEQMRAQLESEALRQRFVQLVTGMLLLLAVTMLLAYYLINKSRQKKHERDIMEKRKRVEQELQQMAADQPLSADEQELYDMIMLLEGAAKEKPQEVALVLKLWLNE